MSRCGRTRGTRLGLMEGLMEGARAGPGGTGRARWAGGGRPWSDVGRGRISSQARRGLLHGRNESSVVWSELRRRPRVTGSPAVSFLGVSVLVAVFLGSKRPEYVLPRTEQGTVWARQPAGQNVRHCLSPVTETGLRLLSPCSFRLYLSSREVRASSGASVSGCGRGPTGGWCVSQRPLPCALSCCLSAVHVCHPLLASSLWVCPHL